MSVLPVALGEYDIGWHDPDGSLARAREVVAKAARAGARLVALPEMCASGFTMEPERFAEPLDGPSASGLARLAREHGVWIIAGLALRGDAGGAATNGALVIDDRGDLEAVYRKQKLFAYAGEHEHYDPGAAPVIVVIDGVRVSPFVCYDLRFPELFRAVAPDVDLMVVIANWPASRRAHWDVLVRARAIENLCWVAAVNRTGQGGDLEYDGGSVAWTPWGELAAFSHGADGPAIVRVDAAEVARVREAYPFLRDMVGPALGAKR